MQELESPEVFAEIPLLGGAGGNGEVGDCGCNDCDSDPCDDVGK